MKEFYEKSPNNSSKYQTSTACPHEIFCQTLCKLTD